MPARGAYCRRQIAREEIPDALSCVDARTVDAQKGAQREILQIAQQIAVERDRARDRERRQGGTIEDRQALQLVERERAGAAPLDPVDQRLEIAPARLSPLAELA